jgi:predicted nucleic acid-binding Zn ribbon protein
MGIDEYGREPWKRQPHEPAGMHRILMAYVATSPRSLRLAVARVREEDGRAPAAAVPGSVHRWAQTWRAQERADAFDKAQSEKDAAAFNSRRCAARARRIERLSKVGIVFDGAIDGLKVADVLSMPMHKTIETLVRLHDDERVELSDRPEDRAARIGEDPGTLPAIEDRIPPPEPESPTTPNDEREPT